MSIKCVTAGSRYNSNDLIKLCQGMGSSMSFYKRWQYSFVDGRGRYYDFYFVCKPTRKQIRNLYRQFHKETTHV